MKLFELLQIDENVQREIINHRSLRHPNIVRFKEVIFLGGCFCFHGFENFGYMNVSIGLVILEFFEHFGVLNLVLQLPQVLLTPTHLAIVMEYAAGGELFERICNAGRFSEDEVST